MVPTAISSKKVEFVVEERVVYTEINYNYINIEKDLINNPIEKFILIQH